jgi:integrase
MLYSGRRFSDVRKMRWEDVQSDAIVVKEQKTGKRITVAINPKLRTILDTFPGRTGYILHPKKHPGKQLSVQGANHRMKHIFQEVLFIDVPKASTHLLRKTFAREVYNRHGITMVSHILNHNSEATSRRYIGLTDEAVEDVFKGL